MKKRVAMATIGTQGDVRPFIALAIALKKKGYSVVLGTNADFEKLVTSYGIEFQSLGSSIESFLKKSYFEDMVSPNVLTNVTNLLRDGQDIVKTAARHAWRMAQGADVILLNQNMTFGVDVAEALDIPAIMIGLQPLASTAEFPAVNYGDHDLGPALNYVSHAVTALTQAYCDFPRNRLRREIIGLDRRRHGGIFKDWRGNNLTTIYAFSPTVSPRPRDWPKSAIITGFLPLPDNTGWEPSAEFQSFLNDGPPPIYIGFGSMPFGMERNTHLLREALAMWGGRAVVARGWGGIDPQYLPDNVFAFDNAPHDKLFPLVAGVVHHGGAGTTSAGLHAGLPTFVIPQAVDQPFWGHRVHALGCGPQPVKLRKLTARSLADGLDSISNHMPYREMAREVAAKLANENGAERAIKVIERIVSSHQRRRRSVASYQPAPDRPRVSG